jgi:hypothetical protein
MPRIGSSPRFTNQPKRTTGTMIEKRLKNAGATAGMKNSFSVLR